MFAAVIGLFVGIFIFYTFAQLFFNSIKFSTKRVVFIVDEDEIKCTIFRYFQNDENYIIALNDIKSLEMDEYNQLNGLILKNPDQKYFFCPPKECLEYLRKIRNIDIS